MIVDVVFKTRKEHMMTLAVAMWGLVTIVTLTNALAGCRYLNVSLPGSGHRVFYSPASRGY